MTALAQQHTRTATSHRAFTARVSSFEVLKAQLEPRAAPSSSRRSSADAGSRGRLFSSSCEERPAVSWHRSLSRSRHDGGEHVVVLAVVVPEGELVEVERQVPRGDVMEVSHDAPLDQRPEAVNGAGMDFAADVLAGRVVHEVMGPLAAEPLVALKLIGRDQGHAIRDRLVHEAFQRLGVGRLDHLADHATLAGDGADDSDLAGRAAPALAALHPAANAAAVPVLGLAADVGFVHLDNAGELLEHRVLHRGADAVAHVPGGPVLPIPMCRWTCKALMPFLAWHMMRITWN